MYILNIYLVDHCGAYIPPFMLVHSIRSSCGVQQWNLFVNLKVDDCNDSLDLMCCWYFMNHINNHCSMYKKPCSSL